MGRFLFDTNCLIAMVAPWHEAHAAAQGEWRRRRERGEEFALAAPCWSEAYSVLTRWPPPWRLSPADASSVLEANWRPCATVALTGSEHLRTLGECARAGIGGGRGYDELIAVVRERRERRRW